MWYGATYCISIYTYLATTRLWGMPWRSPTAGPFFRLLDYPMDFVSVYCTYFMTSHPSRYSPVNRLYSSLESHMHDLYGPMDPALLQQPHPADPHPIVSGCFTGSPPFHPLPAYPHYTGWTPWGSNLSPSDFYSSLGILLAPIYRTTVGGPSSAPSSLTSPL